MNQERILVVEDEPKIAELHRDYLEQSGFQVSILGRGDEVVSRIQKEPADLILLDLMLPGESGEEVCRKLRTFSNIPIIMVTAKTEEIDRLLGLELGADDYICKPFSPREVVARVKASYEVDPVAVRRGLELRPGELLAYAEAHWLREEQVPLCLRKNGREKRESYVEKDGDGRRGASSSPP